MASTAAPIQLARTRLLGAPVVVRHVAAALGVALLARWLGGADLVGYDAAWSQLWGADLLHGRTPDFGAPVAPTPHPLANLFAALVGWLPISVADGLLLLVTWSAFGAVVVGAYALGSAVAGRLAGTIAAAIVLTRSWLLLYAAQGFVDLPYLALTVWAAVLVVRGRRGLLPPALLAIAGLLRPEAWVLAAAYGAWILPGTAPRDRPRLAAALAAGPVLWMASDMVMSGDALLSFHHTHSLAADLGRNRDLSTAARRLPAELRAIVQPTVFAAGVLGLLLAGRRQQLRVLVAVLALGLCTFVALGAAGMSLLLRYLLLPGVVVVVLAAVAVAAPIRGGPSALRIGVRVVACGLLLAGVPTMLERVGVARTDLAQRAGVQHDLEALLSTSAAERASARCAAVAVPHYRWRPTAARWLDRSPHSVTVAPAVSGGTLMVVHADRDAVRRARYVVAGIPSGRGALPPGAVVVARTRSWLAAVAGC